MKDMKGANEDELVACMGALQPPHEGVNLHGSVVMRHRKAAGIHTKRVNIVRNRKLIDQVVEGHPWDRFTILCRRIVRISHASWLRRGYYGENFLSPSPYHESLELRRDPPKNPESDADDELSGDVGCIGVRLNAACNCCCC